MKLADAVADGQLAELLDPLGRRALQESRAGERGRRCCRAGGCPQVPGRPDGGLVDHALAAASSVRAADSRWRAASRRRPTGQAEHPGLVGPEPDADRVRRRRPALGAPHLVVLAGDPYAAPLLGVPQLADDGDRLGQCLDRLTGGAARTAHRLHRLGEGAGPQPELDPPAAEQVEAGGRPGHHGRRPQGQVEHVGGQPDPDGGRGDIGQQGPGVQEAGLIGMVLEGDQIEPDLLATAEPSRPRFRDSALVGVRKLPKISSCP